MSKPRKRAYVRRERLNRDGWGFATGELDLCDEQEVVRDRDLYACEAAEGAIVLIVL